MSEDIAIQVENLTKVYKLYNTPLDRLKESLHPLRRKYHHDFHALQDVNFEINKGETVGIIGKNGSGKSTLLKLITGVLTPTSGKVAVSGKVSALLELGSGFNPELTGIENVYFNGTLMGYSKEDMDNRLDDILGFADIGEFVHQQVKTYSNGMFVRLAFAVAVNVEPDILIIDEALAVGDLRFQKKCKHKMNEYRDNGTTILVVSHGMSDIKALCDKGIYLSGGKMVVFGEASDAIYAYLLDKDDSTSYMKSNKVSEDIRDDIFGTGDAFVDDIKIFQDGAINKDNKIEFGKCIVIEMEYRAINDINKPLLRVNIESKGYKAIASIDNINNDYNIDCLKGHGKFIIRLPNQRLYPGYYSIDIGIMSENVNVHYFVWNSASQFIILPPTEKVLCSSEAVIELEAYYNMENINE